MTALRKLLLLVTVVGALTTAACSGEADVDSGGDGDGVQIEGDIDEKEE